MSSAASTQAIAGTPPFPTAGAAISGFELLLACLSVDSNPQNERRLGALLSATVDWSQCWELSEQHGVLPLVAQRLSKFNSFIPPDASAQLRNRVSNQVRRTLWLTRLLHTITDTLAQAGMCGLAYKGPALSCRLYADVAMREYSDLDILLPESDVVGALEALRGVGLIPHRTVRPPELRELIRSGYELVLDGLGNSNLVEIKWRVLPRFYAIDFAVEDFFERAPTIQIEGKSLLTLCDEDLFLVLCTHAAKHAWRRLSWICDIARLTACAELDWAWLMQRASALGIKRILGISFFLCRELLCAEIPAAGKLLIAEDPQVRKLGRQVIQNMKAEDELDTESASYFIFTLKTRERLRDRVRFIARMLMTPSESEWSMIKLPVTLFPLYRLVRLLRLIARSLRLASS